MWDWILAAYERIRLRRHWQYRRRSARSICDGLELAPISRDCRTCQRRIVVVRHSSNHSCRAYHRRQPRGHVVRKVQRIVARFHVEYVVLGAVVLDELLRLWLHLLLIVFQRGRHFLLRIRAVSEIQIRS